MVRKISTLLQALVLIVSVSFLAACSSKKVMTGSNKSYEALIPVEENAIVFAVNISQLMGKIGDKNRAEISENLSISAASQPAEVIAKEFFDDPSQTGLDLTKNIYLVSNKGFDIDNLSMGGAFYIAMKDINQFEKFLATYANIEKMRSQRVGSFTYYSFGDDIHIYYNNQILVASEIALDIDAELKNKTSLFDSKFYKELGVSNDLALVYNGDFLLKLMEIYSRGNGGVLDSLSDSLVSDTHGCVTLNFEDGEIVFATTYYENPNSDNLISQSLGMLKNPSLSLAEKVKANPYFYLLTAIKGKETFSYLLDLIRKTAPETLVDQEELLGNAESFFNYIDGDVLFYIGETTFNMFSGSVQADASLLIEGKAAEMFAVFNKTMGTELLTAMNPNQILIPIEGINVYIGYHKDLFYITSNKEFAENVELKLEDNLSLSRYFKKDSKYLYQSAIDVEAILVNPLVQIVLNSEFSARSSNPEKVIAGRVLKNLNYMSSDVKELPNGSLTTYKVEFNDKTQNSLAYLIGLILFAQP